MFRILLVYSFRNLHSTLTVSPACTVSMLDRNLSGNFFFMLQRTGLVVQGYGFCLPSAVLPSTVRSHPLPHGLGDRQAFDGLIRQLGQVYAHLCYHSTHIACTCVCSSPLSFRRPAILSSVYSTAVCNELRKSYLADFLQSKFSRTN